MAGTAISGQPVDANYQAQLNAYNAAQSKAAIANATLSGTAQGDQLKALQQASGLPLLSSASGSSSGVSAATSQPLVGPLGSSGSGAVAGLNSAAGVPGGGGSPIAGPQAPDTTAANAATFGAAKDQAGQTARGSLTALKEELGGRGMLGGGIEGADTASVINTATQGINDQTRQNAVTDANNSEQNALAGYSGQVTQRGQDLTAAAAANATGTNAAIQQRAQDIEQRGQNISAAQGLAAQQQAALQGLLSSLSTSTTGVLY